VNTESEKKSTLLFSPRIDGSFKAGQGLDGQVLGIQEIQHLPYHLRFLPLL